MVAFIQFPSMNCRQTWSELWTMDDDDLTKEEYAKLAHKLTRPPIQNSSFPNNETTDDTRWKSKGTVQWRWQRSPFIHRRRRRCRCWNPENCLQCALYYWATLCTFFHGHPCWQVKNGCGCGEPDAVFICAACPEFTKQSSGTSS